jgi:hypothetical protein
LLEALEGRLAPTVMLSISNPVPFPKPDTGQIQGMFVVMRSGDLAPVVQVDYATQDGTGANGAHAGIDYTATSGTLNFAANQTTATISVPILGNNIFQADKTFTVSLSNPQPDEASFAPQQTFATGAGPSSVAVADFNGDGKPDLAVANSALNTVSVLLNTTPAGATAPSFAPQQTFATGNGSFSVAVGDFNGDGKPDLASTNSGSNTVSVLLNNVAPIILSGSPATGTISSAPEAPTSITVAAGNNQSATVNTAFATALAVDVRDAANFLVQGVSVTFTAPTSGASGSFGGSNMTTVVSNASGRATTPTFTANTVAGGYNVTARASGGSNPSTIFSLTNTAGAPATLTATAGSNQSATVNTAFGTALLATLTDQFGNPVPGITVTFTAPGRGASANFVGGNVGTTDSNGQASKGITANTVAGTYSITAQASGGSNPSTTFVNLTNTAGAPAVVADVSGAGQAATVNSAFANPLVARVTDQFGNVLAGVTVTFAGPGYGAGAVFMGGATATTDANGLASKAFSANEVAGTYLLTAQAAGGSNPYTDFPNLTNTPDVPAYLLADAGGDQSAPVNTNFATPLLATVIDQYGNPVPGVVVTFTAPGNGASATFIGGNTATSNGNGLVVKGITANTVAGTYSLTAQAAGGSNPLTHFVNLTNMPAAAVQFAVTTSAGTPQVAGTPFDVTVTALDPYGNTATGYLGSVTFTSADPYGASLPADYTFGAADAGAHTFPGGATLYTAGTWDVTATDRVSGITGAAFVNVQAASAVAFQVVAPGSAQSGVPFDVTLMAVDPYGNTDTHYLGTATWTSSDQDPGVVLPADYTFAAADNGVHTFPSGATLFTPGDQTITAADLVGSFSGSATVSVTGTAALLSALGTVVSQPAGLGTPFNLGPPGPTPDGNGTTSQPEVVNPLGVTSADPAPLYSVLPKGEGRQPDLLAPLGRGEDGLEWS